MGKPYFAYFAAKATGKLLLSGYEGQKIPANFRRRDYYPMLDRLGIKRKTPHATRHTYATRAVKEGLPPEFLQKIIGHADYSTTANIYTHLKSEMMKKSSVDMEEVFRRKQEAKSALAKAQTTRDKRSRKPVLDMSLPWAGKF